MPNLEDKKTIFSWRSLSRPFKKRNRDFYTTTGSIVGLICVILLFVSGSLPLILVIVSLAFLVFALNRVKPEEIEHKITTKGIETAGHDYPYENFKSFYFTETQDWKILNIINPKKVLGNLMILVSPADQEKIAEALQKYLKPEEKPKPNFIDKTGLWLSKMIPLEK